MASKEVDAYIAKAPKEAQSKLRQMRKVFLELAPNATESISYMMPGYDKGRVGWFAGMKNHIGLYLRPPIIDEHKSDLADYKTSKSSVQFPLDKELPVPLIKKLIKARIARKYSDQL